MTRVAVLDDYQGVALNMADWGPLAPRCQVQVFRDHLDDVEALVERLHDFEIITCMRERTPFPRALLARLPQLRLLVTGWRVSSSGRRIAGRLQPVQGGGTRPSTGADRLRWRAGSQTPGGDDERWL